MHGTVFAFYSPLMLNHLLALMENRLMSFRSHWSRPLCGAEMWLSRVWELCGEMLPHRVFCGWQSLWVSFFNFIRGALSSPQDFLTWSKALNSRLHGRVSVSLKATSVLVKKKFQSSFSRCGATEASAWLWCRGALSAACRGIWGGELGEWQTEDGESLHLLPADLHF